MEDEAGEEAEQLLLSATFDTSLVGHLARQLGMSRRRKFRKNEIIFHEGDPGESLHLIAKGHVAIRATTPLGDVGHVRRARRRPGLW